MQLTRRLLLSLAATLILATPLLVAADDTDANHAVASAWTAVDEGAVLIDVRSPEEFAGGHLEGAINIPHTEIDALAQAIGDPSNHAVLYCRSGRRAGEAMKALHKLGYTGVINGTGYEAMKKARG